MTNKEYHRLISFAIAKRQSFFHVPIHIGRHFAKGKGKAVGQKFIKGAREINQVRIER